MQTAGVKNNIKKSFKFMDQFKEKWREESIYV